MTITGTSGGDSLEGTTTFNGSLVLLVGGAGNDTITGYGYWNIADYSMDPAGINANLVTGQVRDGFGDIDTLVGILSIRGSNYNDTLIGTYDNAWIALEGLAGNDVINGTANVANIVSYSQSPTGVAINLAAGTASDGWGTTDTLIRVVHVAGSRFGDSLTGAATNDWFSASLGNDTIDGAGGLNTLDYNTLNGGLASGITVTLTGDGAGTIAKRPWGAVSDSVDVFSNIQVVQGTNGADRMVGWAGTTQDTFLRALSGNDTIDGAKNTHNIADYSNSPHAVVVNLETSRVGDDWFGTASDGHQISGQPDGTYSSDTLKDVAAVYGSRYDDSLTGSSQDDVFKGDLGNDTINGGAGSDTVVYGTSKSAAILLKNADGSWSIRADGGRDLLYGVETLVFSDGVIHFSRTPGDFDGNGRSDILFSNDTLTSMGSPYVGLAQWHVNGVTPTSADYFPHADPGWSVVATGDFNDDGTTDLVWQHATLGTAIWLVDNTNVLGGATIYTPAPGNAWTVAGVGDFNGDRKADILFSHDVAWAGKTYTQLAVWTMDGLQPIGSTSLGEVVADWRVSGVTDFNKDGYADILWRNGSTGEVSIWLSDGAGHLSGTTLATITLNWQIAGTGDFNGDGRSDILWRNANTGEVSVWMMDGTTYLGGRTLAYNPGTDWTVAKTGDFNGDGRSDILWRHGPVAGSSNLAIWLMDGFDVIAGQTIGSVTTDWHIV